LKEENEIETMMLENEFESSRKRNRKQ